MQSHGFVSRAVSWSSHREKIPPVILGGIGTLSPKHGFLFAKDDDDDDDDDVL